MKKWYSTAPNNGGAASNAGRLNNEEGRGEDTTDVSTAPAATSSITPNGYDCAICLDKYKNGQVDITTLFLYSQPADNILTSMLNIEC